ncbi:type IV pilus biogenesis/stability protein PilW [Pseudogulbenkiania subflava]|uniref:Type IV pilus assembly protein PilF n=1 Tax=Pseudogulbenkiania subflava DSM 22618 TaxID=1123014 RepID=A0A1Y6BVR0_9NEIS|nr:type IV pilus assembly protein PilF [Pseudogulbenkiania subflava DSM 22618]
MKKGQMWLAGCLMAFGMTVFAAAPTNELAQIRTQLAVEYSRIGNYKAALLSADQAIAADQRYVPAYLAKAYVLTLLKVDGDAEQNYQKALAMEPANPEANNNYGEFLCDHGRAQDGMGYFAKALANPLYDTPQTAYLNLGRCSALLGQKAQANDYLLSALRVSPNYPPALKELAALHFGQGNAKLAAFYFDRLADNVGEMPADVLLLGVKIARKTNEQGKADLYAARLKSRYPDSKETQELLSGL